MFSTVPERNMRVVRGLLLGLWVLLICSLFFDPWTPRLTHPDNLASPFHIDPTARVRVQGAVLPAAPYPMGARIFWTMAIPVIPMFLMLFGHEAWRRICPLSLTTQLPQLLNLQAKPRVFDRATGQVERRTRLLKAGSLAARYSWLIQFAFLWTGITGRLLFINSNREFLAFFLLGIIGLAVTSGALFGGKTWCNYFCPIAPVQKIYTGPGGLLESKAYRAVGVSQSMCRQPTRAGDHSACVGCTASCPDVDLERFYWDSLFKPGKRFAYYGYFGLVLGFYSYYYLYAGNWTYYFSGAWTHETGQLSTLFSPGFYFGGAPVPVPKVIAAPLTTGLFVLLAYGLGVTLEAVYGRLRALFGAPLNPEALRHHGLTASAYATFNAFYLFGGRPNLALLPPWLLKTVDVSIVLVSTLWLSRALRCGHAIYKRESMAQNVLRQLRKLKVNFAAILEGRTLEELNADEVYILGTTLSGLPDERRQDIYRNVLLEAIGRGEVTRENSLEMMKEVRQQMGISEEEHGIIVSPLLKHLPAATDSPADPGRVRLLNYTQALESVVERCLESGNPVRDEITTRDNDREIRKLRDIFDVSDAEHEGILRVLLGENNLALGEAQALLEEMADTAADMRSLNAQGQVPRIPGIELLIHHLERRQRSVGIKVLRVLSSVPETRESLALARWFNVTRSGELLDLLELEGPDSSGTFRERLPAGLLDVFREDASRSLEVLSQNGSDSFDDLRRSFTRSSDPRELLARTSRGVEGIPAAVALCVLNKLDSGRSRLLAERALLVESRSWLTDEVARSVLDMPVAEAEVAPQPGGTSAGDGAIEPVATVDKMLYLFKSSFFQQLGLELLASIARNAEVRAYQRGGIVCSIGEKSDRVFVVCQGSADVCLPRNGGYRWINVVSEGDSIGELGVFTEQPRSATVIVNRDSTRLISIEGRALLGVLNRSTTASMGFLKLLSGRQQAMLARM